MAKLYFRYGMMSSGKSTVLLQAAYNYEERGQGILLAKSVVNTKGDVVVASRLGMSRDVDFLVDKKTNLRELLGSLVAKAEAQEEEPIAYLLINEAQSLSPAQVDNLLRVAIELTIPVIAYGIRTGFLTHFFPGPRRPPEIAHSLEELKTIRHYGKKTMFSRRTINGVLVFSGEQVTIDGVEVGHGALCPACYFEARGLLPYEAGHCHGGAC